MSRACCCEPRLFCCLADPPGFDVSDNVPLLRRNGRIYAALLLNVSAVFSLSSGSWILPDGPLFFFMLATVDTLLTLVLNEKIPTPASLDLGCFLIGLGLLSKYHAVFIPLGMGLFF